MPETEVRTRGPKIATVERREVRVPFKRKGSQGASQAPRVPAGTRPDAAASGHFSALRHPSLGAAEEECANPGANASREGNGGWAGGDDGGDNVTTRAQTNPNTPNKAKCRLWSYEVKPMLDLRSKAKVPEKEVVMVDGSDPARTGCLTS
jgi:hypothetical protein